MMQTAILAGVVYVYTLYGFCEVIRHGAIRQLWMHSQIARMPGGTYVDLHVLAGLKPFANAVKLCVIGSGKSSPDVDQVKANRKRFYQETMKLWKPKLPNDNVQIIGGFVNAVKPPIEALVSIDAAIEGPGAVDLYPIIYYPEEKRS